MWTRCLHGLDRDNKLKDKSLIRIAMPKGGYGGKIEQVRATPTLRPLTSNLPPEQCEIPR